MNTRTPLFATIVAAAMTAACGSTPPREEVKWHSMDTNRQPMCDSTKEAETRNDCWWPVTTKAPELPRQKTEDGTSCTITNLPVHNPNHYPLVCGVPIKVILGEDGRKEIEAPVGAKESTDECTTIATVTAPKDSPMCYKPLEQILKVSILTNGMHQVCLEHTCALWSPSTKTAGAPRGFAPPDTILEIPGSDSAIVIPENTPTIEVKTTKP